MAEQQDHLGQHVGGYRLLRQLGRGSFGAVYLAEHLHNHSQAAVKLLRFHLNDPEDFKEFLNEARTMRLRHPHIVPLFDFGLTRDNTPYLVMEYAAGGTLRQRNPKGTKLSFDILDSYVSQLASALQYAHDHRVIHRDVKPENVLLRADGALLLSDFGIAKVLEQSSLVSLQTQVGTPAYMAPEQSRGKPCPASDQYSLAVMVYEWLAGRLPFQGASLEVMLQHRVDEPPSLQEFCLAVPIPVEQVVMQALKKTPEERFKTVEQFAQALHTILPVLSSTDLMTQSSDKPASNSLTAAPLQPTMPASPSPNPSISPLQTIWPTHSNEPLEHSSGSLRPLETPSPPLRNMQTPQPQLPLARPLRPSPAHVGTVVPHSPSKRLEGRTLMVTLLCLVLLVSLAGGGAWTFLTQQRLLNSQHTTATAQAAPFVTATAAASAYNTAIATNGIQFGFDAQHTHYNPYERILTPSTVERLVQAWTAQTGGSVFSPAVANGVIYVGSDDHKLYAFKADGCGQASCAPLWTAQTGDRVSSDPVVANGVVYVGSDDHKLYAFKADGCGQASCAPLWTAQTGGWVGSSVVANGVVYVGSYDNKLYAFKADGCGQANCAPLWTAQTGIQSGDAVPSSPAVANGIVYVGSSGDYKLYAFKADGCGQASCAPLWTAQTGFVIDSSPAVANGVIYITSSSYNGIKDNMLSGFENKLYAFKADGCGQANCTPLWIAQTTAPSNGFSPDSSPAVANGVVYVGSADHYLYAFKADGCGQASCAPLWTAQTGGWVGSSAVANGVVYVGSADHYLYAFKADGCGQASCAPLWTAQTGGWVGSSVVANGVVYVGSDDHKLYAFHL